MYPTIQQKAARLAFSIVKNHPFVDGNKRSGIHVMLVFLAINGILPDYTQEELIEIGLKLADGSIDDIFLFQWLLSKTAT
jgi:death-on-curing protein